MVEVLEGLFVAEPALVALVDLKDGVSLDLINCLLKVFFPLTHLQNRHCCVSCHLLYQELAVAKFADFTERLLTLGIDAPPREHPFLRKALLAVTLTTKLAEMYLRRLLENEVFAADTCACRCLLGHCRFQKENRVLLVDLKLVLADSHSLFMFFQEFNSARELSQLILHE